MDQDYVESLLIWNERGALESARQWFVARRFNVIPMRAGLLIAGPRARFEATFGVDLEDAEPPVQLPIPREVRQHVASFGIPKIRQFSNRL